MGISVKYGTKENPYGSYRKGNSNECGGESCATCKYRVCFGKLIYCGYTFGHVAMWETIRFSRSNSDEVKKAGYVYGCMACKHVKKKLSCDRCIECLATEDLVNFVPRPDMIEWEQEKGKTNETL